MQRSALLIESVDGPRIGSPKIACFSCLRVGSTPSTASLSSQKNLYLKRTLGPSKLLVGTSEREWTMTRNVGPLAALSYYFVIRSG